MENIFYLIATTILSFFLLRNYNFISSKICLIDNKNPNYAFKPTPTGAGIIFLIVFVIGNMWFFLSGTFEENLPNRYYLLILSSTVLSLTSFRDDIKPIDPILRLLIQFVFIYISLSCISINELNIPLKLSMLLIFCTWVYITNITNFIDGTDGFLITHVIFFYLNVLFLNFFNQGELFSYYIAIIILPCSIIFFHFNKPKAKLFMGDAGSIFFGFLFGFSFFEILFTKNWGISLSLMAYPFTDCTICLIKKLKKKIMPWIGMYDYYFLKPVIKNKNNHFKVLIIFFIFNFLNLLVITGQYLLKNQFLFLISYLLAIISVLIFDNFKKFAFFKQ